MAVDTRQKRMSMLALGDGTGIHLLFEPDGSVDADDRLRLLDLYSGIAASAPEAVVGTFTLTLRDRDLNMEVDTRSFSLTLRDRDTGVATEDRP